jgi:hypothetical protein
MTLEIQFLALNRQKCGGVNPINGIQPFLLDSADGLFVPGCFEYNLKYLGTTIRTDYKQDRRNRSRSRLRETNLSFMNNYII